MKGKEHSTKSYSKEDSELALHFFKKATELDSNFDEAFGEIAELHMYMFWGGYDRTENRKALAKEALDKAMEIDSENPDVRIARGYYYYHGFRDSRIAKICVCNALSTIGSSRVCDGPQNLVVDFRKSTHGPDLYQFSASEKW
mgnify:CR=1 FL=1